MKKRLSTPRAATVIVLAAVVALSVTVAPSIASSFLTSQAASKKFVTNQKAAKTYVTKAQANAKAVNYLTKKAAANTYVAKKTAPLTPVVGIAAGTTLYSNNTTVAGYIPTAFTSFATPAKVSSVVITFSGNATCTAAKPGPDQACPVSILVDGQVASKVNLVPSTAATPTPVPIIGTATITSVLSKGGHTVAVQYAGAKNVTFTLKGWNLAVQATPQPEEAVETPTTTTK